jgi:hypothetical protein
MSQSIARDHLALTEKLSRMSVSKRYEAFVDVEWDAPENAVDAADPRWQLPADDPIGGSDWYLALPPAVRARFGLHRMVAAMKIGWQFENALQRGLLEHANVLPEGSPEIRYVLHEVIEESQHQLMFMELVRRAQLVGHFSAPGIPPRLLHLLPTIISMGRRFPELFYVFVLGGEDPIDMVQKQMLASPGGVHPLIRRIMQIHVTEEARHIAFARSFLASRVPNLSPRARAFVGVAAPVILGVMARLMLRPGGHLVREYGIPPEVVNNAAQRRRVRDSVVKVHGLCRELGLIGPTAGFIWRKIGVAT